MTARDENWRSSTLHDLRRSTKTMGFAAERDRFQDERKRAKLALAARCVRSSRRPALSRVAPTDRSPVTTNCPAITARPDIGLFAGGGGEILR